MPDRRAIAIRHGLDVVKRRHAIATSTDTTPGGKGSANDRRSRRHVADGGERPRPGGQNETGCLAHPSSHNPFRRPTNPQPHRPACRRPQPDQERVGAWPGGAGAWSRGRRRWRVHGCGSGADCAVGSGQWAEPPHSPTTVHRRGSKSRNFWRLLGPRRQGPGGGPGGARRPGPDDPPGPLVTRRSPRGAVGGRLGPIPEGGPVPPGREPSSGRRPGGASGG